MCAVGEQQAAGRAIIMKRSFRPVVMTIFEANGAIEKTHETDRMREWLFTFYLFLLCKRHF